MPLSYRNEFVDVDREFFDLLKSIFQWRKSEFRIRYDDIAPKLGYTSMTLRKIASGHQNMKASRLKLLLKYLPDNAKMEVLHFLTDGTKIRFHFEDSIMEKIPDDFILQIKVLKNRFDKLFDDIIQSFEDRKIDKRELEEINYSYSKLSSTFYALIENWKNTF